MCSTPAPPSTAFVASCIWSGVGDVKTSPGQAASSIPRPTKPPCIGSCPEPPPEMMPTLPWTGASARTMTIGSCTTRTLSPWAASMPSSASRTTASGSLMSFFMCPPLGRSPGALPGGTVPAPLAGGQSSGGRRAVLDRLDRERHRGIEAPPTLAGELGLVRAERLVQDQDVVRRPALGGVGRLALALPERPHLVHHLAPLGGVARG